MSAREKFEDALRDRGHIIKGNSAQCPAHPDSSPSLSIGDRRDGKGFVLKCHGGCENTDVMGAVGMTLRDLFDDSEMRDVYAPKRDYSYPGGRRVHRKPDKSFPQSGNKADKSLFHADRIGDAHLVYVVEGEKDVEAIEAVGGVAVCSAMGAGKADRFDWTPLTGLDVIVVADKDTAGRSHATDIVRLITGIAQSVRVVESASGKDAADHIAGGRGLHEFVTVTEDDVDPMTGAELLDELYTTITKYVVFPDEHATVAVTLWTASTHATKAFQHAPRLVLNSPQKRCGKSRALDIIGGTCHQPLISVNATVAAIFRSIGDNPPTLIIDEADTLFGTKRAAEQNEDLRALLNAGHQRNRPALRCVGPQQIPTEFPTFAMAALAGIGSMPDTITDRAINITMRRRTDGESVSQFRSRRDGPILVKLCERLAVWAAGAVDALTDAEPAMPVEDRAADTWEPLIAVADAVGGDWPKRGRAACVALVAGADEADEDSSLSTKLLADIKTVFTDKVASFLSTADLVAALRAIEESPWNDFEFNARKLAQRLRQFGVKPGRDTSGQIRGYTLESLTDAFARYTRQEPSDPSETTFKQQEPSDTSFSSDTSIRQTENIRQNENAGQTAFLTGLTGSDAPPATNGYGSSPTCPGCGHYFAANGHHSDNCTAQGVAQ